MEQLEKTKKELIEEKVQSIKELIDNSMVLLKRQKRINNYPKTTRYSIAENRIAKTIVIALQLKSIMQHINSIKLQPLPIFEKGGMVKKYEEKPEIILLNKELLEKQRID